MQYMLYLIPFLIAFFLGIFFISILLMLRKRLPVRFRSSARHIHHKEIMRFGGIAMILSFLVAMLLDSHLKFSTQLAGVFFSAVAILVFGLLDDIWEIHWKPQLFFQIAIVLFTFILGIHVDYITNPFGGVFLLHIGSMALPAFFLVIVWMIVIMNAMNWVDGVDGLSGGITLIGMVTIFFLSLKPEVNQPPVGILAAIGMGSVLAFLVYNFYPARIMAGTSGSLFMGFLLAVFAIIAGAKIATALLVTAVPIIDALWVILERLRSHKSIFEPDKNHLHHKFLQLGWSQRKICLFFYLINVIIAIVALNTRAMGKLFTILTVGVIMLFVLAVVHNKTKKYSNAI